MTQEEMFTSLHKQAEKFATALTWDEEGTSERNDIIRAFKHGAISERNKVLDELISKLDRGYKDYAWYKYLRLEIESLKVDL